MLTYQSQARHFKVPDGTVLTFPCSFEARVTLGPPQVFGVGEGPLNFLIKPPEGAAEGFNTVKFNANTGRVLCVPRTPLPALDVVVMGDGKLLIELKGNILRCVGECNDLDQLHGLLVSVSQMFPSVLNVYFADPPVVLRAGGTIGSVEFNWEHSELSSGRIPITTAEEMEKAAWEAFNVTPIFNGTDNRRLAAGLQYFYVACRLFVAGNSQWEFMAEHVLNLCKALEIMFGCGHDKLRKALTGYGYTKQEIECEFIPLLLLRNHFDIAHARTAIMNAEQLRIVYRFLSDRSHTFRELFKKVVEGVRNGRRLLPDHGKLQLSNDEQRKLDDLVSSMAKSQSVALLTP